MLSDSPIWGRSLGQEGDEVVNQQEEIPPEFFDRGYFDGRREKSAYEEYTEERLSGVFVPLADLLYSTFLPARLLDCGCAKGFLVKALRKIEVDAYGQDISAYAIASAPLEVSPFLKQGSITEIQFPDRFFDLVVCLDTMEHLTVSQAERALDEMARVGSMYFFLTICINLDPSCPDDFITSDPNDKSHITIANRNFWHKKLLVRGLRRRQDLEDLLGSSDIGQKMRWNIFVYEKPQRRGKVCLVKPEGIRVGLVTADLRAGETVGNSVLCKFRYLREHGYEATIFYDGRIQSLPDERERLVQIDIGDLYDTSRSRPGGREAITSFRSQDLHIYEYAGYYSLVETIRTVPRGIAIFDYHGVKPLEFGGTAPDDETVAYLLKSAEFASLVHYGDYAIVHSEFMKRELVKEFGFDGRRVFILPPAISLDIFCPGPKGGELQARYGLGDEPLLLYAGNMAAHKKIEHLVKALALVKEKVPGAKLLLVGDDSLTPYLPFVEGAKRIAKAEGIEGDVIFAGPVAEDLLPRYYNLADLFVTASQFEGSCLPLIEAMACGKPVIGADAAAIPATIVDAGLTFKPGDVKDLTDKIVSLLTSRELWERSSRKGLERAKDFSHQKFAERFDALLEAVMETRTPDSEGFEESTNDENFSHLNLQHLTMRSDISFPYEIRSNKPLVGGLIAWVRRNLTSHLKEPYIDRLVDRQTSFNFLVVRSMRRLMRGLKDSLKNSEEEIGAVREKQRELERQLDEIQRAIDRSDEELKGEIKDLKALLDRLSGDRE